MLSFLCAGGSSVFSPRAVQRRLLAQALPGAYPRKIEPFGLILALLESFLRLAPGLRQILASQGRLVGTANISTLSYALASRLHRDLVMAMLDLLSAGQVSGQDDILVLDSMAVSIPKSRRHNCAKMNNQTVGGGVLWSFCITAKRGFCPVRVLKIMQGAWHDGTVMKTVELVAKGPLHIMDRGFYTIDMLNRWLDCGVRFLIRARGKDLVYTAVREIGPPRELRAKTCSRGPLRRAMALFDGIALIGGPQCRVKRPTLRILVVRLERSGKVEELTLMTDDLELDAQKMLDLYGRRWEIEEFHRLLKRSVGLAHLYSFRQRGIETLLGIATLLAMLLWLEENVTAVPQKSRGTRPTVPQLLRQLLQQVRREIGIGNPWRPNTIGKNKWRQRK